MKESKRVFIVMAFVLMLCAAWLWWYYNQPPPPIHSVGLYKDLPEVCRPNDTYWATDTKNLFVCLKPKSWLEKR